MAGEHTWSRATAAGIRWSSVALLAGTGILAGCFANSSDSTGTGPSGGSGGASATSPAGAMTRPLLVDVDTGGTLVTTAGNGIGVYVEYESGGLWSVSWTCDTVLTSLPCNFVVDASVPTGTLTNPASNGFQGGDSLAQTNPQEIEAVTTTTTGVDAMIFDAMPGEAITVSVALNAPVSFFFVQDGKVNGGYTGTLTNPLMFQPSTP